MATVTQIIARFAKYVIDPAILVVFAAGFFVFIWGLVEYLYNLEEGGKQQEGVDHMKWGIIGMLVMVSVYGIIAIMSNTFGLGINTQNGTYTPDTSRINDITLPANFTGN